MKEGKKSEWKLYSQTEVVEDSYDPDFGESILIDWYFEKHQYLKFKVFDIDGSKQELIGEIETEVAALIGAMNQTFMGELETPKSDERGSLVV